MLTVRVNGQEYDGFSEVSMIDDVTQLCNQFKLACTFSDDDLFPVYRDSEIMIYNDNEKLMTGVVEIISGKYSDSEYEVSASGRDITRNVLKNDIPPKLTFKGPISLESVIKKTLKKLDIDLKVENQVDDLDDFTKREFLTAEVGDNTWDFWLKLANKRQVLITKDPDGKIVIKRPQTETYTGSLYNLAADPDGRNNVLTADWVFDDTDRRYEYNVYSQQNVSVKRDESPPSGTEIWEPPDSKNQPKSPDSDVQKKALTERLLETEPGSKEYLAISEQIVKLTPGVKPPTKRERTSGTAIDNNVLPGSSSHKISEDPADDDECLRQAKWQANQSRIKSVSYTCTVQELKNDGEAWKAGKLINVYDEIAQIQALMLITRVEYNVSNSDGTVNETVTLTLTLPDAYSDSADVSDRQQQTNIIGSKWNNGDFQ